MVVDQADRRSEVVGTIRVLVDLKQADLQSAFSPRGQQGWCIAYFSFSLGSQNEHACYLLYWPFDQAFYPCRIGTNHHCIALEQLSGRRPATSVHRYRFILRTWSNLTTLRGLVRSQSCLVRRNWTKKRECSTGTTANKDLNYIDNCSSPSPSLRL